MSHSQRPRPIAFCPLFRILLASALMVPTLGAFAERATAAETHQEFLRGLRDRQYYDMAIFYLDQLATKSSTPADIKAVIPFEKAITLLERSRGTRNPERQLELLDQALAFLEQFIKESPNHPMAANANTERAQILLGKGRVEILQSNSPANAGAKTEYQKRARDFIKRARDVFQTAANQHEATWKSFPTYIDKNDKPEEFAKRQAAETSLIRSMIDLALCTLEEARTYDAGTDDNKRLLIEAANQFEALHQRYRSQVAGLFARVYQGKCFEEVGDLQKALGIYNELLAHPGNDAAMARLKDQTLHFKLISLNSDARRDYQLVVDLGREWMQANRAEVGSSTGLGIRWQVARAYEMLGDQREMSKADAERNWRSARDEAVQVNRFAGEYKDVSLAMMQRLDVKIGGKERQPETFDAAFGLGRQMIGTIQDTKEKLEGAKRSKQPKAEIQNLQDDYNLQLVKAAETFDLALRLATSQDDRNSINQARYMYAYVNFLRRRNYEAAILAEFVAKSVDKENENTGLEAAYLSMAAYVQAYNDVKGTTEDKDADLRFIIKACNLITDRWPDSDSANDARMTLGRIYTQLKEPVAAAEWYNKVPESSDKFSEAQLAAGQAYWTAYLTSGSDSEEDVDKPTPEQLTQWRVEADRLLKSGIAKLSATAPKEGVAPPELIAAKMSLAQITISLGKDAEAVKLLVDDPQSVIKAITVADETKRPDRGVQSRLFATETYKLLLRAYIGSGKLNEARQTMTTLEKVAGAEAGADVTELYVGLGKLLRDELDRFRDAGETERFNSLMTSFETFLNDLYQRQEGQTFGSLSWIGETYFALGEAASNDPARSTASFEKAGNAFQKILEKAQSQLNFVSADQISAVKSRLVRCYRLKKQFEDGEKLLTEMLAAREKDLKAQFEGAYLYQDWAANAGPEYYLTAINGKPEIKVWGWRNLGIRLQNAIDQGQPSLLPSFVEARLNGTRCRHQYALAQTSLDLRSQELEKAEIELVATVTITKGLTEEQLKDLNDLYRQVLQDAGKEYVELKPSPEVVETAAVAQKEEAPTPTKTPVEAVSAAPPPASTSTVMMWLGIASLLGLAAVGWMLFGKSKKRPQSVRVPGKVAFTGIAAAAPPPEGPPTAIPTPPQRKARPAATGAARAATPGKAAAKPGAKVPSPRAAGQAPAEGQAPAAGAAPRPRPKPPTKPT